MSQPDCLGGVLADYVSSYRRVLDHFDAAKVALTATRAQHTAQIAVVYVVELEQRAASNPQNLNRTSIVDLLKLVDIDSSLEGRKALPKELFCPDELMGDSAKMNVWLHKNVLGSIAANGDNMRKGLHD